MSATPPPRSASLRWLGGILVAAFAATTVASFAGWEEPHVQVRFYALFLGVALLLLGGARCGPRTRRAAIGVAVASVVMAALDVWVWWIGPPWQYWATFVAVCAFGFVATPLLLMAPLGDADDRAAHDAS